MVLIDTSPLSKGAMTPPLQKCRVGVWDQPVLGMLTDVGRNSSKAASIASFPCRVFYGLHLMFASTFMFQFIMSDDLITVSKSSF